MDMQCEGKRVRADKRQFQEFGFEHLEDCLQLICSYLEARGFMFDSQGSSLGHVKFQITMRHPSKDTA